MEHLLPEEESLAQAASGRQRTSVNDCGTAVVLSITSQESARSDGRGGVDIYD